MLSTPSSQPLASRAGPDISRGSVFSRWLARDGYELIIGSSLDAQFGPVLLFGAGGQLVEVIKDRALGLPPLNSTLARRMMEQTKIFTALLGIRGRPPVDLPALEQLLVRFSYLVVEQRGIKEIDINPLLASTERLLALDARVIVHDQNVDDAAVPRLAIRPYPEPVYLALDSQRWHTARSQTHSPRGRASACGVPWNTLRADRRTPLLQRDEAEHSSGPRAFDADLLHRL